MEEQSTERPQGPVETPLAVEPPQGSVEAPPAPVAAPLYASLWQRLLAQLVDGLVALGIFLFIGMSLAQRFGGLTPAGFELTGWPAALVITVVGAALLAYFALAEGLFGATLGKATVGIRVATVDGRRPGLKRALIRNLLRLLDGQIFYLVGAMVVMVTKQRQRIGDLAAGSVVIRREGPRALRIAALIVAILIAVAGGVAVYRMRGFPVGPRAQIYPVPDLNGFRQVQTFRRDMAPAVAGEESTVDLFENGAGDRIFRFTTGTVVWAYGWVPKAGGTEPGYIIRSPRCAEFTERLAATAAFSAPDCAVATIRGG